jgi:hypothetical protein
MLPRLSPVNKKPKINKTGFPVKIIIEKPTTTKLHKNIIDFFLPKYNGNTPAIKPATRLPTWWADINPPLTVSFNPYSMLIKGKSEPKTIAYNPFTAKTKKQQIRIYL